MVVAQKLAGAPEESGPGPASAEQRVRAAASSDALELEWKELPSPRAEDARGQWAGIRAGSEWKE